MNTITHITAAGVDTYTDGASSAIRLRIYEDKVSSSTTAADIVMTPAVAAEAIADLAYALRKSPEYAALAAAINDLLEATAAA